MNTIDAIKAVLDRRADILRQVLRRTNLSPQERSYYAGKKDGYDQAIDLLTDTFESICVELPVWKRVEKDFTFTPDCSIIVDKGNGHLYQLAGECHLQAGWRYLTTDDVLSIEMETEP